MINELACTFLLESDNGYNVVSDLNPVTIVNDAVVVEVVEQTGKC